MNLFGLLKEYVGLGREEVPEWFVITESETETVLKPFRHLDGPTFNSVYRMAVEHGGTYDNTPGARCFHIPKHAFLSRAEEEDVAIGRKEIEDGKSKSFKTADEMITDLHKDEEDYALSRSLKGKLGQLVPCLEDAEGIIFDGKHRKTIDPKAWTVKVDRVKTPVDRALARMTVNFCRRHYTSEEMRDDIGLLVGSGLTVKQISETTGISEVTVYKYMPQDKKDQEKSEAISRGIQRAQEKVEQVKPLTSSITTQDIPQFTASAQGYIATELRSCEKCGRSVHRSKMGIVAGMLVCPRCGGIAEPKATVAQPSKPFKPRETGAFRVGLMHPQKSKFELAVIQELQVEGLPLETDREFCVQKTTPDAVLKVKDRTIAIYIDNVATHEEGNERDEFLRGSLQKLYGYEVLPIQYKNDSLEERQRAKEQIREFLKW